MVLIKFVGCFIIQELSLLKRNLDYFMFFINEISLTKYLIYLTDNNKNPFKFKEFINFLKKNQSKWSSFKGSDNKKKVTQKILVENFINHPFYSVNNILVGKYLEIIKNKECVGFLRKGDLRGKFLLKSFGVKKFYFYNFGSIFLRIIYLIKALKIISKMHSIKDFNNLKIDKLDIGLLTYDTFLRYSRIATTNKFNLRLINFFAEALYANDYISKIISKDNITELVQSEKQFIPLNIFFQKFLTFKTNKVYARVGTDKLSVRIYSNFEQRHENKARFSKKILNYIYKNKKKTAVKTMNDYFNFQFKNQLFGNAWATLVNDKKNLSAWTKNWQVNKSDRKKLKFHKRINFSKKDLCKKLNWCQKNKIVTIFLPHMIDGNYQHGRKNLYKDNYSWSINTLNQIKKIKNINWIIREHPQESRYNTISNFDETLDEIINSNSNIARCPDYLNPKSLIDITDIALTSHGTAGLEYQAFGKPVVVAENSLYVHFGFRKTPKNIKKYEKILKNIHLVKKPKVNDVIKAKTILFVNYKLSKIDCDFITNNKPEFESRMYFKDHKIFWAEMAKINNKFQYKKDNFFNLFKKQIYLQNRHTVDFKKYKIKERRFDDLNEQS